MLKKITYLVYIFLYFFDKIFQKLTQRSILDWLNYFIEQNAYFKKKILKKKIIFFCPNYLVKWRVETLFTKEPDTLSWIDNFEKGKVFWDIGANIGIYSIYAAIKLKKKIEIIAFEPSTSNTRVLSRNISINNLEEVIKIFPIGLSDREGFFKIFENEFIEGVSLNSLGKKINFEGKKFISKNKYQLYGNSIDNLLSKKILKFPSYIKIDVDGLEHVILKGAENKLLKNDNIVSVLVEINESYKEQFITTNKIMKKNNFKLINKSRNAFSDPKDKFYRTFNYIFEKK
jgi:FkbM family methyltransferase